MSKWYDQKLKDMSLSRDGKELDIYVDSDEFGAIWVSVKVEDVKKILEK